MRQAYLHVVSVLLSTFAAASPASAQIRAFVGGTIIDGNGGKPIANGVLVVEGDRIQAIGPSGKVDVPSDAERIDVSGRYIMPGIMDANVHLVPWPSWTYIEFLARYEDKFDLIAEEGAQLALKKGVTTVFDSMGPADALILARDRINRGETPGARIFVAGDIVGFRAVFTTMESIKSASKAFQARIDARFELNGGPDLTQKTPQQIYEEMRKYAAKVDFVKYGATGDGPQVNSEIGQGNILRFSPDQQAAIVRAVHDEGKIVQTHQGSAESLHIVVTVGNDMAQHCAHTGESRIYEETIQLMLKRGFYCGTQWGPLTEEEKRQVREGRFSTTDYGLENSIRLIKAGVPQLVSTDAGTIDPDVLKDFGPEGPWGGLGGRNAEIGEAEFINMQAMLDRGMTPMMILQAATKNIAAAYKKLDVLGTLEAGKYADLLVLEADPLADIANMRKIAMVVKEGKTVRTDILPSQVILTSPEAKDPGPIRKR
jgi:imidazolonepropionase-like amidohydrolase